MKPIIKWAGGKSQILSDIKKFMPVDYNHYHEPMLGGGALFFDLEPEKGTVNDLNKHIIRFYEVVKNSPKKLIEEAEKHPYDEEHYYKMRDKYNRENNISKVKKAALFLYFNKTAYNGLWRVNSKGGFNVPFGKYSNPKIVDKEKIMRASKVLDNVRIFNQDFKYILDDSEEGDLVYFDPPYQPVSDTADFTAYTKEGFDLSEQKRLFNLCISLHKKGVKFILSNSYAKPIKERYESQEGFYIMKLTTKRYINCKGDSRNGAKEILVTNVKPGDRKQSKL